MDHHGICDDMKINNHIMDAICRMTWAHSSIVLEYLPAAHDIGGCSCCCCWLSPLLRLEHINKSHDWCTGAVKHFCACNETYSKTKMKFYKSKSFGILYMFISESAWFKITTKENRAAVKAGGLRNFLSYTGQDKQTSSNMKWEHLRVTIKKIGVIHMAMASSQCIW